MNVKKIIEKLSYRTKGYESKAVNEVLQRSEEFVPLLIEILDEVIKDPLSYCNQSCYYGDYYALMLLGHLKEVSAHISIVNYLNLDRDLVEIFVDDIADDQISAVLMRTCGGDFDFIRKLILNDEIYEKVRIGAIYTISFGVVAGMLKRAEAVSFYQSFLKDQLDENFSSIYDAICTGILSIHPKESMDLLKTCYKKGCFSRDFITWQEIVDVNKRDENHSLEILAGNYQNSWDDNFKNNMNFPSYEFLFGSKDSWSEW